LVSFKNDKKICKGYDFNKGIDYDKIFESFLTTGFQATNFGEAIKEVNRMLSWRLCDEKINENDSEEEKSDEYRKKYKCKIFLSYTSNMISSGVREIIRFLCEHHLVHVVVTTAGGIEEDIIKCLAPTYMGDFSLKGSELRKKGINRTGNLLVPNTNYCMFEEWINTKLNNKIEKKKKKKKGLVSFKNDKKIWKGYR